LSDVTQILASIERGDPHAAEQLLPMVYDELRRLAAQRMAREQPGQTLQATALVHEAYLRLVGSENGSSWDHRGHFFAAAAESMRRILVERARKRASPKHGGPLQQHVLEGDALSIPAENSDVADLDEALDRLTEVDAEAAELVKLRFFAGLTVEQSAALLGMSTRSAYHTWNYARAWLRRAMQGE
jgi:RNA polymerase sigma factor (TIGR02999 family)